MPALAGSQNHQWRGGITVDPRGYPAVLVGKSHPLSDPHGYCRLHALVLAAAGVTVEPGLDAHHANGDKADNRLDNLVVIGHAEHAREHAATQPRERGKFARREGVPG